MSWILTKEQLPPIGSDIWMVLPKGYQLPIQWPGGEMPNPVTGYFDGKWFVSGSFLFEIDSVSYWQPTLPPPLLPEGF